MFLAYLQRCRVLRDSEPLNLLLLLINTSACVINWCIHLSKRFSFFFHPEDVLYQTDRKQEDKTDWITNWKLIYSIIRTNLVLSRWSEFITREISGESSRKLTQKVAKVFTLKYKYILNINFHFFVYLWDLTFDIHVSCNAYVPVQIAPRQSKDKRLCRTCSCFCF